MLTCRMQNEEQSGCSFAQIRTLFLTTTKGTKGCKDRECFSLTCSSFMTLTKTSGRLGQLSFTDPEIFRLKKNVVEGSTTNCE